MRLGSGGFRDWQSRIPQTAWHPGIRVKHLISNRGMTQARLAKELGFSVPFISDLIRGRRDVSPRLALALAEWFDVSPVYWLELQMQYDLHRYIEECRQLEVSEPTSTTRVARMTEAGRE